MVPSTSGSSVCMVNTVTPVVYPEVHVEACLQEDVTSFRPLVCTQNINICLGTEDSSSCGGMVQGEYATLHVVILVRSLSLSLFSLSCSPYSSYSWGTRVCRRRHDRQKHFSKSNLRRSVASPRSAVQPCRRNITISHMSYYK